MPRDDYDKLIAYTEAVAAAMRSKDFSAFH
jgi:hypothetical protein